MADYSVSPLDHLVANQEKGYVGLHIEQGVPVLDRDLNLLHDLVAATVRAVVTRYIGNGSPAGADGFGIEALVGPDDPQQDFRISAGPGGVGRCLVGGLEVTIPPEGTTYRQQPGVPGLTAPTAAQPDPRIDTVYVDAFLVEVDSTADTELANALDVGLQTSVRLKPGWVVRVAEGKEVPPAPPGHAHHVLAELARPRGRATISAAEITDRRQRGLTVSDMDRRLRRVETALLPTLVPPQFLPRIGGVDAGVTITGTNFNIGTAVVRFGEVVAHDIEAESPTLISVGVPRGIATEGAPVQVFISVENAAGRVFADSPFTVLPTPAFAAPGAQFTPSSGGVGTPVTIRGQNLNGPGLAVRFGSVTATVVGTSTAREVVAAVPPGLVPAGSTTSTVRISVTTDEGTATSDDDFRVSQALPPPAFATTGPQFTPKIGSAGQSITLRGQNFDAGPVTVRFGSAAAPVVGTPTPTQIVAQVPSALTPAGGSVTLSVTTPGGTTVSTDTFTVTG